MTFDRAWALLLLVLPALWAWREWRNASHVAVLLKAAAFLAIIAALAQPRLTYHDRRVSLAVLVDTSASVTPEDIGLPQQARLYERLARAGTPPPVIDAGAFLHAPEAHLRFLCRHFGIDFTPRMLEASIRAASLEGVFEYSLSTDEVHSYKPAPAAYGMALNAFKLAREQIVFVAFAGWDAAGARSFGYKTFWVNRLRLPAWRPDQQCRSAVSTITSAFGGRKSSQSGCRLCSTSS